MLLPDVQPVRSGARSTYQPPSGAAHSSSRVSAAGSTSLVDSSATTTATAPSSALGRRRLSPSEMAQCRAAGLCYNCDEKFVYGHKCKKLFILEVAPEDNEEEAEPDQEEQQQDLNISLHALTSIRATTYHTMRIWVHVGKRRLTALLDSGSTHNFIIQMSPLNSTYQPSGTPRCESLWAMHPSWLTATPCRSAAMTWSLGIGYLCDLGPILWDFGEQTLCFNLDDCHVGIDRETRLALHSLTAANDTLLGSLLDKFSNIFREPTGLPPQRAICHHIRLLPGTNAVAVRPYRYAQIQKDELERCHTPHSSAFSSPALLVCKQDGSWRLCIDYRALNAKTIKDKYPIPVVEELLDELRGARYFTKLDLRSGYHQVLMHPGDTHKTAFRTHQGLFEFLVMPFGLTNAPATFQALMNTVLQKFLRRFVLTLSDHCLFFKQSKCSFAAPSVAYLGHVISAQGITMDSNKVKAVLSWPVPKTVRAVRGFLGLASYYRRFIKDFGTIAAPLTRLLRKEGFRWTPEADGALRALRNAITTAPPFIVECDASGSGFGAVLHQGSGAVAFFSKPIAPRHAKLAAYERELIGLVQAVRHWRPYLWGRQFVVKTDHYSLKFLLDQCLATIPQHQWASKLMGFDFTVEFKPGYANVVADALSHRDADDLADQPECAAISGPSFSLFDELKEELDNTSGLDQERAQAHATTGDGKVFVRTGHEGIQKTLYWVRASFYVLGDRGRVCDHVSACRVCQQNKSEQLKLAGFLQPLQVPSMVWADIAMDFVEGLPRVHGKTVILTMVDRFSKFAHIIPLAHPYTATTVARAFFTEIVRLHGIPSSIVSDRDPVFTSAFWRELFCLSGVQLNMSSAYHPQSDGQSEATNKIIAMYLRCLTGDRPRQWLQWLAWAEYCYNSSFQASLGTSPFRVVYGRDPPSLRPYDGTSATLPAVDQQLRDRDEFLAEILDRLEQVQQYQKAQHDRRHREVSFTLGQWVWLWLLHRPAASLDVRGRSKLGPQFFGPFQVLERVGEVPACNCPRVPRFMIGDAPTTIPELASLRHGRVCQVPLKVVRGCLARGVFEVLVQWQGLSAAEASWMPLEEFRRLYPMFQLEDELLLQAGRDSMCGRQYQRRHKKAGD
ncbi:LOW QUALITY PROTEIN: hypothetical protein U9M48_031269 [Paspalum notatum var. saurae]|uniref:Uncharacterized protein n=1 Tax=Paspalum notatum var. saurae TaxID=547442 RepID=A0AAQ3U6K0_PASNO